MILLITIMINICLLFWCLLCCWLSSQYDYDHDHYMPLVLIIRIMLCILYVYQRMRMLCSIMLNIYIIFLMIRTCLVCWLLCSIDAYYAEYIYYQHILLMCMHTVLICFVCLFLWSTPAYYEDHSMPITPIFWAQFSYYHAHYMRIVVIIMIKNMPIMMTIICSLCFYYDHNMFVIMLKYELVPIVIQRRNPSNMLTRSIWQWRRRSGTIQRCRRRSNTAATWGAYCCADY